MDYSYHEIDINYMDRNGNTPLHRFVNHNKYDSFLRLLQQGANPNIKNNKEESPLYLAAKKDQIEMIADLLEHEADIKDLETALLDILKDQSEGSIGILSGNKNIQNKNRVSDILLELASLKVTLNFEVYYCANLICQAVWSNQHIGILHALTRTNPSLLSKTNNEHLTVVDYLNATLQEIKNQADNETNYTIKSWFQKASHSISTVISLLPGTPETHSSMHQQNINTNIPRMRL